MSKKLFVVSDVHSFFKPLRRALNDSGFDPADENHWLIVCGDAFDRGSESSEVLRFLMSLDRKILIKGNHESLIDKCCTRGFPYAHDYSNGTVRTIADLGEFREGVHFDECCRTTMNVLTGYRKLLVNYFETQNYIFVHSWIPTISHDDACDEYDPNWRKASQDKWENAMWVDPFDMHFLDTNKTGKTIVFGHWHCSAGHKMLGRCKSEFGDDAVWSPCFAAGIIGIDRCTAYTGEVNVLVLDDEFI